MSAERKVPMRSGSTTPVSARRPRELVRRGPEDPAYADLVIEPLSRWAIAVAENFVWLAAQAHSLHTVEDCWVDKELALCARYRNVNGKFGVRFGHAYISPLTGMPLDPTGADRTEVTARWQASNFLDVQLGGGGPDHCDWVEGDGREWWGTPPTAGWSRVVDPSSRVVTIQSQDG
ncbi:hypothetical protein [Nocardia pseudobrasiliensis]|uniref:hypothetical protein n=1 Tax=Nocardia pseudobrasiliensis TaxID=45979 RepID=UPI0011C03786|nr:hypothetical protein [Nocardia pseudobrasiliensis]